MSNFSCYFTFQLDFNEYILHSQCHKRIELNYIQNVHSFSRIMYCNLYLDIVSQYNS